MLMNWQPYSENKLANAMYVEHNKNTREYITYQTNAKGEIINVVSIKTNLPIFGQLKNIIH